MEVTWAYPVALGRLTAGQAGGLNASVGSLVSSGMTLIAIPGVERPLTVTIVSQIPAHPGAVHRRAKALSPPCSSCCTSAWPS